MSTISKEILLAQKKPEDTCVIWNHHLASKITNRLEGNFRFVYETNMDYSYLQSNEIITVSDDTDESVEMEASELKTKDSLYNIIQSKMNLNEKRGPKFFCNKCRYSLHTRLSMITHMKHHLKPFCEVCFAVFESNDKVIRHIDSAHPEVIIDDRQSLAPCRSYYNLQTIAPPNTPTAMSDDELKTIEGLIDPITKYVVNVSSNIHNVAELNDSGKSVSTDDEPRLVIDDNRQRVKARGRPRKKPSVLKRQIKKSDIQKSYKIDASKPENALKKITSRFGRAISLKVPQY